MGQYERHVFVCTSGETCPKQGDVEAYVKTLRAGVQRREPQVEVRVNKAGCFSQCGHGPMVVVYPDNVWYAGVQAADLDEILTSHILGGPPGGAAALRAGRARGEQDRGRAPDAATRRRRAAAPRGSACAAPDEVPANGMKEFPVDGVGVSSSSTPARCSSPARRCAPTRRFRSKRGSTTAPR